MRFDSHRDKKFELSLTLSEINIYPVKSLGGISLATASITDRGLQHDRRWLITDQQNQFITQRECKQLALLKPRFVNNGFEILDSITNSRFTIPFNIKDGNRERVKIWNDECVATHYSKEADDWLSDSLETRCKLFFMGDQVNRKVNENYARNSEIVSFADGYPFLIIGQSSLDDLNRRLKDALPMNRFRPNFVFTGGEPNEEDLFDEFKIGDVLFRAVKPCERCVIPTIDQDTAEQSMEPTATLATYRKWNNKICFGQNLLCDSSSGTVNVGDTLTVMS
jgi:uncharacterized protein YcbX